MGAKTNDTKNDKSKTAKSPKIPTMWWKNSWLIVGLALIVIGVAVFLLFRNPDEAADDGTTNNENADSLAEALGNVKLPENVRADEQAVHYINAANAYKDSGDEAKRLEYLILSYETYPHIESVTLEIADIYKQNSDTENEKVYLNYSVNIINEKLTSGESEESPDNLYFTLGVISERLGDNEAAKENYNNALKILKGYEQTDEVKDSIEGINSRIESL